MSYPKLKGTVQAAPNKSQGFDVDSILSRSTAERFYNDGYRFCLRYLSLGVTEDSSLDLTHEEANNILDAGLALMPVQHVRGSGWKPNADLGIRYGERAAEHADQVGFPPGVNVWCDLEGIDPNASHQSVIDYCNNWYDKVAAYGYLPGLYVGANSILDGEELYEKLKFKHYWKSMSDVPHPAERDYQMIQYHHSEPVHGLSIDKDVTYIDKKGGQPQWLVR